MNPEKSSLPKPSWFRNMNKASIREKQLKAAMDPDFDPNKFSVSSNGGSVPLRSFSQNRAVVTPVPTLRIFFRNLGR